MVHPLQKSWLRCRQGNCLTPSSVQAMRHSTIPASRGGDRSKSHIRSLLAWRIPFKEAVFAAAKETALRRSACRLGEIPQYQRAGARRRSPQGGSAGAGAHIARARRGKMRTGCPQRRRQSGIHHPIEMSFTFWTRGVGGRRGCRGACPSHPLPLAGRRPNLDAGPYPPAGGRKNWRSLQSRPFNPSPGGDPTSMPGRIRRLAAEKIGATCRLGPLVPRREATQPRCRAVSAGRRQQK